MPTKRRRGIDTGIRIHGNQYEVYWKVGQKMCSARFPLSTPVQELRDWRRLKINEEEYQIKFPPPLETFPAIERDDTKGYCYIYFIRRGLTVKIGRSMNPQARMRDLQVAHPESLELMAAIPAHSSLEGILHRKFHEARVEGEWFDLTWGLNDFIIKCRDGRNPIQLLWDDVVSRKTVPRRQISTKPPAQVPA